MNTSCDIAELMCPGAIHDLGWLKRALQAAIKIRNYTRALTMPLDTLSGASPYPAR